VSITLTQIEAGLVDLVTDSLSAVRLCRADAGGVRAVLEGRILDVPAIFWTLRETAMPQSMEFGGGVVTQVDASAWIVVTSYDAQDDARQRTTSGAYAIKGALCALVLANDLGVVGFAGLDYVAFAPVDSTETRVIYRADFRCYSEEG